MSTPGWYPDPQDPHSLRYYDGQAWTEHQQAAPGPSEQPQPFAGAPDPAPPYGQQDQPGLASGQQPQYPAEQYPTEQYPPQQYAQPYPAQPGQPPYPPGPAAPTGGKRGKKLPIIIGLVVVVVAGLLTGGYFLLFNKGDSPEFTYAGKEIKDPAAALKTAETNLTELVKQRHGAKGKQTHCYYAMPTDPDEDTKDSDVAGIYCGPVLFVDGDPSQAYLKYSVRDQEQDGGVTITPSAQPTSKDPTSIPKTVTLKRPDDTVPPDGAGGLKPPAPPPADAGTLVATQITDASVPDAPDTAVIGSWNGRIQLTKLGTVARYGHGDDARSAPSGGKLIAFQTDGTSSSDLTSETTISIDGATGKPVPDLHGGDYVVVAVPADANSVDLVLDDEGLTQTISLLDGKPGKNNVVLFTRSNTEMSGAVSGTATFTFSPKVKFGDGTGGSSESAKVTLNKADLMYKSPPNEKPVTASDPSKALMHVSVTYRAAHDPGEFGFPPELLTFTPEGGSAVKARNISPRDGKIYNVFEVPANMTSGTLTISGSVKQSFSNNKGSYTWGIKTPVKLKVSIPLDD